MQFIWHGWDVVDFLRYRGIRVSPWTVAHVCDQRVGLPALVNAADSYPGCFSSGLCEPSRGPTPLGIDRSCPDLYGEPSAEDTYCISQQIRALPGGFLLLNELFQTELFDSIAYLSAELCPVPGQRVIGPNCCAPESPGPLVFHVHAENQAASGPASPRL